MTQELEFPADKVDTVELRSDGAYILRGKFWVIGLEGGETFLGCLLVAANVDTFYVSCEHITGNLPDYVKPMKRDE